MSAPHQDDVSKRHHCNETDCAACEQRADTARVAAASISRLIDPMTGRINNWSAR